MFTIKPGQEKSLEERYYQEYLDEFSAHLREHYPDTADIPDTDRREMIDAFHSIARRLKLEDPTRVNTFIICAFLFGDDALTGDAKLISLFKNASYETEGMVQYVIRRIKMKAYAKP